MLFRSTPGNVSRAFLCKRVSFAHEQQVRAIIAKFRSGPEPVEAIKGWESGVSVHVDLNTLIEEIFVAPTAPDWIRSLITAVTKRYGLTARVVQSRLSEDPVY